MRVALVTAEYPGVTSQCGGMGAATEMLAKGLIAYANCSVDVVVAVAERPFCGRELHSSSERLNVYFVGGSRAFKGKAAFWIAFPMAAFQGVFSDGADVVHYQTGALWALFERRPKVLTVHGILEEDVKARCVSLNWIGKLKSWIYKQTEGRARKNIPNVVAISDYSNSFLDVERQKVWDIPNSVSDDWFDFPVRNVEGAGSFLVVSRLTPLKNIVWFISSFARLLSRFPNITCRIAGGGLPEYVQKCQSEIDRLNVGHRVKLLGSLTRSQLIKEMQVTDCVVLPSLQENAPMVIAEAMASGVQVVASDVGGIAGMLRGSGCRLFEPGDFDQLSSSIVDVVNSSIDASSLREFARYKYSVASNSIKTEDMYKLLLGRSCSQ